MKFKIYDKVIATEKLEGRVPKGTTGTIKKIFNISWVGVEWDIDIGGHSLSGICEDGYGYNVNPRGLKKIAIDLKSIVETKLKK